MKKNEVLLIKEEMKRTKTTKLQEIISAINDIIDNRQVSRNMWFWSDNGNRYQRQSKEDYYFRDIHLKIGKHLLYYYRHVSMSRKHVYVNEHLDFDGSKITVADLNKLIVAFEEIINSRTNK